MNASINTFRFFAFFAVYLFHIGLFDGGYLGVQAFFVLSGFLLTPILVETKKNTNSFTGYLRNFLVRRFLRIFPLYYLYLISIFVLILLFQLDNYEYFNSLKSQLIYAFTYTYNFYHQTTFFEHNHFLAHFWSLAVEEQFYIFWPILIYFVPRKHLVLLLTVIVFMGPVLRIMLGYFHDLDPWGIFIDSNSSLVYFSTVAHIDAFAIGGLFSLIQLNRLRHWQIFGLILFTIALGLFLNFQTTNTLIIRSLGYPPFMSNSFKWIWGYSIVNLCFVWVIKALSSRNFLASIFENKVLASLGVVSYGLYVYHFGVIYCAQYAENIIAFNFPQIPSILYDHRIHALFLTILVSYLSYYLFEKWFIDLKDKLAPKNAS